MADSGTPALRRSRRSSTAIKHELTDTSTLTPAQTPRRGTKRVRFSDPGPVLHQDEPSSPSTSSGLTPMIRRTSLFTPKRRRVSTPSRPSTNTNPTPSSLHSHQTHDIVTDDRVQRRLRRANVRDMVNKFDLEKKRSSSQLTALRSELRARDQEIYELQNATIIVDNERIWDLERQVSELQREVERRTRDDDTELNDDRSMNWTLAARDPFEDDFMDLEDTCEGEDSHFGNATMGQFVCSTPSKARTSFAESSFPTPPATSPTVPMTPTSRFQLPPPTPSTHASVQVCLEDPENKRLQEELASLRLEMSKLTGTLDSYRSLTGKLNEQLTSTVSRTDKSPPSPLETLEGRVADLLRSVSDRAAALQHLTQSIGELGFPGSDASEMLTSLATHFRAARLELEYLTPGEVTLPLTSHGAEVLDLLLSKLRELATRVKEGEDSVDEYHEIEQSLRKQLDARVTVMNGLRAEMGKAQELMTARDTRIRELEIGNDRLKGAVSGYVRDISELEKLVGTLEQQANDATTTLNATEKSTRQSLSSKDELIEDLEVKLSAAARRAESLQQQFTDTTASHSRQLSSLNKQHGKALALRDARVAELRGEIDRVNESIRAAHETIRSLRVENGGLQHKMDDERRKAKGALDAMKEELQRVLQMSQDFLNTPQKDAGPRHVDPSNEAPGSPLSSGAKVVAGNLLSGGLARRSSKKLGRRLDSGIGLSDDEQIEG